MLLQSLLFAAAATFAVALAVWLHGLGRDGAGTEDTGALSSSSTALPLLRDARSSPASLSKLNVPLVSDLDGPPLVRRAIPINEASVTPSPGVAVPAPVPAPAPVEEVKPPAPGDGLSPLSSPASPVPYVYQAVLMNDLDWLGKLLKAGFPIDEPSPAGDTALCAAVNVGNKEAALLLLEHKADPNKPGKDGQPPLALASLRRADAILSGLLEAGADPNAVFVKPVPEALLGIVKNGELRVSLRSDTGVTPLMAVAARGDVEGTLELLKHGAKTSQPTKKYFRYPINYAAEQRYIFLMRLLLGRAADSEPDILVTVDLSQQKAYLQQFGKVIDKTSISTGREGYATPPGRYAVTDKHKSWTSTIYKVSMPWFMRLNCSAIGLHAGYVTGSPASHGCIRLPPEKARKWFSMVKVGDEVQIVR